MFSKFVDLLHQRPELVLFLVLGFGYLIGKLKVKGFEVGSTAGVLFAGLFFGHFQFKMPPLVQTLGFILFIYSVGFRVGPQFFRIPKKESLKYMILALVVAVAGFVTAAVLGSLFGFEQGITAGLMAGALTSTPTLAAAQDVIQGGQLALAEGISREQVVTNIGTSYAIAYIFGLAGLLVFIRFFPRWLGLDLAEEVKKAEQEMKLTPSSEDGEGETTPTWFRTFRVYELSNAECVSKTVSELENLPGRTLIIKRIKRGGTVYIPERDDELRKGDLVFIIGLTQSVIGLEKILGPEVLDQDLVASKGMVSCDLVVNKPAMVGKDIFEVGYREARGCYVHRFTRLGVEMPLQKGMTFEKGDVFRVSGSEEDINRLAEIMGHVERNVQETDLLTFAFGIAAGILIGSLAVKIGEVSLGLGMAGGLLVSGLTLGYLRSVNPTFGRVPPAARFIFMEFGLMLFMAGVGLNAGEGILEALLSVGPSVFLCGVAVTVVPVVGGYFFGTLVLKANPALLLGGITGAMTSTPALNIVNDEARSPLPALGYTAAYAVGNVILTIAGILIIRM